MREGSFFMFRGWSARLALILSLLVSGSVYGITFQVSDAEEFQAALTAAAGNGSDNEIILSSGTYFGNFTYRAESSASIEIGGDPSVGRDSVVLDGEGRAFTFRILASAFELEVTIENLTIINGDSGEDGGGLAVSREYEVGRDQLAYLGGVTVSNLVISGNYSTKNGGGISVKNFSKVVIKDSEFSLNTVGESLNGSHVDISTAGRVEISRSIEVVNNQFLPTSQAYSMFGTAAINVQSQLYYPPELYSGSADDIPTVLLFEGNVFSQMGGVLRSDIADPGWYSSNFYLVNLDIRAGGLDFKNNIVREPSYTSEVNMNASKILMSGNRISGSAVNSSGKFVTILENHFDRFGLPDAISGERFIRVNARGGDIAIERNTLEGIGVEVFSSFDANNQEYKRAKLVGNSVWMARGRGLSVIDANEVEIVNNSVALSAQSGIHVRTVPQTKLKVANNVSWSNATSQASGLDIEREGYGFKSALISNIYQSVSELWDTESGNVRNAPLFYNEESGDLHLQLGSLGINAGANDALPTGYDLDLDGNVRVLDANVDIGAFERSITALHPADTSGDSVISSSEFEAYNSAWRANEVWTTSPTVIPIDFVTRAGYLLQKGGAYKNIGVGKPQTWVPANE